MQDATGTLVVLFGVQVVVTQRLPALPVAALHEETPTGPTVSTGQVVVVQPFSSVGPLALQVPDGTLVVLFVPQVVILKLFKTVGIRSFVHDCTGTATVTRGDGQVMPVQLFPTAAVCGEQLATGTAVVLLSVQTVDVQLLPEPASALVQLETGTLDVVGLPQTVAV